jgi:hypothetical protein
VVGLVGAPPPERARTRRLVTQAWHAKALRQPQPRSVARKLHTFTHIPKFCGGGPRRLCVRPRGHCAELRARSGHVRPNRRANPRAAARRLQRTLQSAGNSSCLRCRDGFRTPARTPAGVLRATAPYRLGVGHDGADRTNPAKGVCFPERRGLRSVSENLTGTTQ